MRFVIIFSVSLLILLKKTVWCIPLNEFYPFGVRENDLQLQRGDDISSPEISLPSAFPFYDQNFQTIFVNTNGALSFTNKISMYDPEGLEFPIRADSKMIAPYWADVDTSGIGNVTYRMTTDAELLQRADDHIRRAFPTKTFSSNYLFIATWDHVGFYLSQTIKTNTFQAILATDTVRSFVIFLYADGEIQWTSGDGSHGVHGLGGTPAQVGFNAGDGTRHTVIPASYTNAVINITHTSNVDIPGVWVFRVDEDPVVIGGCQSRTADSISLFPRYGNVLGGTAVQVFGPCFDEYADRNITCSFGGIEVAGVYVDKDTVICVSPALRTLGRVDFTLDISGTTIKDHKTTFYSLATDDASSVEVDSLLYMSNDRIEVTWDRNSLLPELIGQRQDTTITVNIQLVEIDIENGGARRSIVDLASGVPNSGRYNTTIPSEYDSISPAIVKITIDNVETMSLSESLVGNIYNQIRGQLAHWSREIYVSGPNVLRQRCEKWYNKESGRIGEEIVERLPACPPTENRTTNNFVKEDYGDAFREFFHPGTSSCYRQAVFTRSNQGSGQQCCYDKNSYLVTGQPGGGTVDRYAPNSFTGRLKHLRNDVLPYVYCCKGEFKEYTCDMYYKKRPSDDGSRFSLQPPACMYGDPHLVTLDGYKYTFNGKGEFTLIGHKDDIFTLQGRMVEAEDSSGLPARATVFSAIAAKQNDSDTVEFKTSRRGLDVLVNGVMVDLVNLPRQEFNNVTLSDLGNNMLSALFSSGAYVQAKLENGIISVLLVSLPDSFYNATYGLMGVFNRNVTDDLMIRNSNKYLPLNSHSNVTHLMFGLTWITDEGDSLFTYSSGESWATYYDRSFTPSYDPQFSNPSLESNAINVCDDDEFCLYDIATTGRIEIGLSTLDGSRSFDEIVTLSYPIICEPACEQGACVANNTCNCAKGYIGERCTEPVYGGECGINRCENGGRCFKMAASHVCDCVNGHTGLLCEHDARGPNSNGSTGNEDDEFLQRPTFVIAAGVAGAVIVILVVMVICAIGCCCHRRYKRRKFTVNSKKINHTNPMYDMSMFLVPDKAKTDTTSSNRPLVPRNSTDTNGVPPQKVHNYANQREYDTIAISHDLRMTDNPSYTVP